MKCDDCTWFEDDLTTAVVVPTIKDLCDEYPGILGQCRAALPKPGIDSIGTWPLVSKSNWCGEFHSGEAE